MLAFLFSCLIGYAIGSVPFAFLIARAAGVNDIREVGSGNSGATNVIRAGYKMHGLLVLILDVAKGVLAVFAASIIFGYSPDLGLTSGIAAVVGHIFPVWLSFKGGKGVATSIGVLLATHTILGVFVLLAWIAVFLALRYVFLASLCAMVAASALSVFFADLYAALHIIPMSALVCYKHSSNIRRFLDANEIPVDVRSLKLW